MKFEKIPGVLLTLSGIAYASGLVLCLVLAPFGFTLGFMAGGGLVLANSWASANRVRKAQFSHKNAVMASLIGGFYVRLIVLGVCLFACIRYLKLDPVGVVTGLSIVPVGLVIMLILIYIANRRPEEVS
ncbi:MAG: ATP synthase subunit I [Thermodesulfobacteriota bacterium]